MGIFPAQFSLSQTYIKDIRQLLSAPQWDERWHCCPRICCGLWESEQADRVLLLLIQSWQDDHCWRLRYLKSVTVCNWPLENKSKFLQDEEWELNSMLCKSAHTPRSDMLSPQAGRVAMETETPSLWIKCVVKMAVSNLHIWFHLDPTLVPLFALSFLVCSRTPI